MLYQKLHTCIIDAFMPGECLTQNACAINIYVGSLSYMFFTIG